MGKYIDIADIRTFGVTEAQADDTTVTELISMAEEFVDGYCKRSFTPVAKTLYVSGNSKTILFLDECLQSATGIFRYADDTDREEITNYRIDGYAIVSLDGLKFNGVVEVQGTFGNFTQCPISVKKVCVKLVAREVDATIYKGDFKNWSADGISFTLANAETTQGTGDPSIDRVLNRFKNKSISLGVI